jgi:hypothetical protein
MANRFWVGAGSPSSESGDWGDTDHWSETNGGDGGASVPTSVDAVYIAPSEEDAEITISGACACDTCAIGGASAMSLVFNGASSAITAENGMGVNSYVTVVNEGDCSKAIFIIKNGSLYFKGRESDGGTYEVRAGWDTGDNDVVLSTDFQAIGYDLASHNSALKLMYGGTFDTNSKDIYVATLLVDEDVEAIIDGTVRAKTVSIGGAAEGHDFSEAIFLIQTLIGATGEAYAIPSATFELQYECSISGDFSIAELFIKGNTNTYGFLVTSPNGLTLGDFTVEGGTESDPVEVSGYEPGTEITATTVDFADHVQFRNITALGDVIPWTGNDLQDGGDCENITFNASASGFIPQIISAG